MEGRYHFSFADIRRELDIGIDLHDRDRLILQAHLWGQPTPLTAFNHLKTVLRHPILPHLTTPRIYREAFKLRFKRGLTYHSKPVPLSPMTVRRNPPTALQRRCRNLVIDYLERTRSGTLQLTLPEGPSRTFGGQTPPRRTSV